MKEKEQKAEQEKLKGNNAVKDGERLIVLLLLSLRLGGFPAL